MTLVTIVFSMPKTSFELKIFYAKEPLSVKIALFMKSLRMATLSR